MNRGLRSSSAPTPTPPSKPAPATSLARRPSAVYNDERGSTGAQARVNQKFVIILFRSRALRISSFTRRPLYDPLPLLIADLKLVCNHRSLNRSSIERLHRRRRPNRALNSRDVLYSPTNRTEHRR